MVSCACEGPGACRKGSGNTGQGTGNERSNRISGLNLDPGHIFKKLPGRKKPGIETGHDINRLAISQVKT